MSILHGAAVVALHGSVYTSPSRSLRVRGFTAIELLVVITITALLASLILPAMRSARESAQAVICASNLRSLGEAEFVYVMDNHQYFTYAGGTNNTANAAIPACDSGGISWDDLLGGGGYDGRHLSSTQMTGNMRYIAGNPNFQPPDIKIMQTLYKCPGHKSPYDISTSQWFARSYEMNSAGSIDQRPDGVSPSSTRFLRGISYLVWSKRTEDLPDPSGTFLLVEGDSGGGNVVGDPYNTTSFPTPYGQNGTYVELNTSPVLPFHTNSSKWNYLIGDGHVSLMSPFDTYGTGNYGGPSPDGYSTVARNVFGANGYWTVAKGD